MPAVEIALPGDKSIAHRAVILGALAQGESRIDGVPAARDVDSTIGAALAFGARIARNGDSLLIRGAGIGSLRAPDNVIDCGNSGTTARLCMGLAAALPGTTTLDGDASLRRRPMERVAAPLRSAGARIEYLEADGHLPMRVTGGRLQAIHHRSDVASAQVKSALLVAALAARVDAHLEEPALSRDHTERMLHAMGVGPGRSDDGRRVGLRMSDAGPIRPLRLRLPRDFSAASFFLAGALHAAGPRVTLRGVGLNPTRTGFLDVARRMGADVTATATSEECGEPVGDLALGPGDLVGTRVAAEEVVRLIDELPLVAVLGAHARGETRVTGAAELRAKESDRIRAVCSNLASLGVNVADRPDGFVIRGAAAPLVGRVDSFDDHRIAMAFAVLGLRPGSRIDVDDIDIAGVSFPGFATQLERLRAARPANVGGKPG